MILADNVPTGVDRKDFATWDKNEINTSSDDFAKHFRVLQTSSYSRRSRCSVVISSHHLTMAISLF